MTNARGTTRLLGLLVLAASLPVGVAGAESLSRIRVENGGRRFVDASGKVFVPFGVNYYRPGTGWAPQVWKQFDPEATNRDFARLKELGANCVRVFLTYGSFYPEPGRLDETGMGKLEQFLDLASEHGIYVHPTGPDHWEGLPEWARGDRLSDETVLSALEEFWRLLGSRLRGRTTVFAYDLLNEPEVPWDTPVLRKRWNGWLAERYRDEASLANAWKQGEVPKIGEVPPPPKEDAPNDPRLLDFQRFREDLADAWTRRQAAAIRQADPEALVTVGLIQWSVPVVLGHVGHYSAFRPSRQAPFVDFLSFHFYPLERGAYRYAGEEDERRNLAYLDCLVNEHARFGKPVVIGEFGWYGGGKPRAFKDVEPATEEQQARWCRRVVETTRGRVSGWLNWGFHDQPEATDVSQFTGLLAADGTLKAWGREFRTLAAELREVRPIEPEASPRPELPWDALVTSRRAAEEYRASYLSGFRPR